MGRKKLLGKLADFFDLDIRAKEKKKEDLYVLLKRLKKKEVKLKEDLKREQAAGLKNKISQKIEIVHNQRKKGVIMCKALKKELRNK